MSMTLAVGIVMIMIMAVFIQPILKTILKQVVELLQSVFGPHNLLPLPEFLVVEQTSVKSSPKTLLTT